jgi:hypothetical protein
LVVCSLPVFSLPLGELAVLLVEPGTLVEA